MFASIRSYNGVSDIAAIRSGARKSLYPLLRKQAGFVSSSLIDAGVGSLTSVRVFNTRKQAEAANSAVRRFRLLARVEDADRGERPAASVDEAVRDEARLLPEQRIQALPCAGPDRRDIANAIVVPD